VLWEPTENLILPLFHLHVLKHPAVIRVSPLNCSPRSAHPAFGHVQPASSPVTSSWHPLQPRPGGIVSLPSNRLE
ncbi:hypothetical protein LEMLEM_LOCUS16401, partial [Lemmus lemmus]